MTSFSTTTSCHGAEVHALQLPRVYPEASDKFKELVAQRRIFIHAKRKGMIRPRAMNVHHHLGVGVAGDVVEVNRGVGIAGIRVAAPMRQPDQVPARRAR